MLSYTIAKQKNHSQFFFLTTRITSVVMAAAESDRQFFMVQAEDGRKFKMVIRGDLSKIPVEKIRRYLKAYGVPDGQTLSFDGRVLTDDMVGEDFDLQQSSILFLSSPGAPIPNSNRRQETNIFSSTPETLSTASRGRDDTLLRHFQSSNEPVSQNVPPGQLAVDHEGRSRQQRILEEELAKQQQQQHASMSWNSERPSRVAPQFGASPGPSRAAPFASGLTPTSSRQPVQDTLFIPPEAQLKIQQLESDNMRLKREVDALKLELEAKRMSNAPVEGLLANAKSNLLELGKELGVHLAFDSNLTCAIGNDERHTILATFDAPTERLYLYSTILTFLPEDAQVRLKLYEVLLDGALLGRDVAGGGIGASIQSGLVMMSTSIPLRHCGPQTLKDIVPVFVEALVRWRAVVSELLELKRV